MGASNPLKPTSLISSSARAARSAAGLPFEFQPELDVSLYRAPRQQPEFLEHHRALTARTFDEFACESNRAAIGFQQAQQNTQEGAFPASGGSDDADELTPDHFNVEIA